MWGKSFSKGKGKGSPWGAGAAWGSGSAAKGAWSAPAKGKSHPAKGAAGKGKAGGKGESVEQLEAKLATTSQTVYEQSMDLNVPMSTVTAEWNKLAALRARILAMYGITENGAPAASAVQAKPLNIPDGEVAWKQRLNEAASKVVKRALTKAELDYMTIQMESKNFACTLQGPTILQNTYESGEFPTRKAAEAAAAKKAMQREFPEMFRPLDVAERKFLAQQRSQPTPSAAPTLVPKRKADEAFGNAAATPYNGKPGPDPMDPKSLLAQGAQLLLKRPIAKTDLTYVTAQEGQGFITTVDLVERAATFQGEVCSNQKDSERSAARGLLDILASDIEVAREEHRQTKELKAAEKRRKMEEARESKVAAAP